MDYHSLPRRQLQLLCKRHGLPANSTNVQMADALSELLESNPRSRVVTSSEQISVQNTETKVEKEVTIRTAERVAASRKGKLTESVENENDAACKPAAGRTVRTRKFPTREVKEGDDNEKECSFASDSTFDASPNSSDRRSRAEEFPSKRDSVRTRSRLTQSGSPSDIEPKEEETHAMANVFKTCLINRENGEIPKKKKGPVTFSDVLETRVIENSLVKGTSSSAAKRMTRRSTKQLIPAVSSADDEVEERKPLDSETSDDGSTLRSTVITRAGKRKNNTTVCAETGSSGNTGNELKEVQEDSSAQLKASDSGQEAKGDDPASSPEPNETTEAHSFKENQMEFAPAVRSTRQMRKLASIPHKKDCVPPKRVKGNPISDRIIEEPLSNKISGNLSNKENKLKVVCQGEVPANQPDSESHRIEKNADAISDKFVIEENHAGSAPRRHSTRKGRTLPPVPHGNVNSHSRERISRKHVVGIKEQGFSLPATRDGTNQKGSIQISDPCEIVRSKMAAAENTGNRSKSLKMDKSTVHSDGLDSAVDPTNFESFPVEKPEEQMEESEGKLNSVCIKLPYGGVLHVEEAEFKQVNRQLTEIATDLIDNVNEEAEGGSGAIVNESDYVVTDLNLIEENCKVTEEECEDNEQMHPELEGNGCDEDNATNNLSISRTIKSSMESTHGTEDESNGHLQIATERQENYVYSLTKDDEGMNSIAEDRRTGDANEIVKLHAENMLSHTFDATTFVYNEKRDDPICRIGVRTEVGTVISISSVDVCERSGSLDKTPHHDFNEERFVEVSMENDDDETSSVNVQSLKQDSGMEGSIYEADENCDEKNDRMTIVLRGHHSGSESSIYGVKDTHTLQDERQVVDSVEYVVNMEDVMDSSLQVEQSDEYKRSMDESNCLKTSILGESGITESDTETDAKLTLESENRVPETLTERERIEVAAVAAEEDINKIHLEGSSAMDVEDVMDCSLQVVDMDSMDESNCSKICTAEGSEVTESVTETYAGLTLVSENGVSEELPEAKQMERAEKNTSKTHLERPFAIDTELACSMQLDESDKDKSFLDESNYLRISFVEGSEVTQSDTKTDANLSLVSDNGVSEKITEVGRIEIAALAAEQDINKMHLEGPPAMDGEDVMDCYLQVVDLDEDERSMDESNCLKISPTEGSEVIELDTETDANLTPVSGNGVPEKLTDAEQLEIAGPDISKTHLEGLSAVDSEDVMGSSMQLDGSDKDKSSMDESNCLRTYILEGSEITELYTEADANLTLVSENQVPEMITEVEQLEIAAVAEADKNKIYLEGPSAVDAEYVMKYSLQVLESDKGETSTDESNCLKISTTKGSEVIEFDNETDANLTVVSENGVLEKLTAVEQMENDEQDISKAHLEGHYAIYMEDVMDCSLQFDESNKDNSSMDESRCLRTSIIEGSEATETDTETDGNLTLVSENRVPKKLTEVERIEIAAVATEKGMNKIHMERPSSMDAEDVMDCSLQVVESDKDESSMNELNCLKITTAEGPEVIESDTETDANITLVSENGAPEKLTAAEQVENAEQDISQTHLEGPSAISIYTEVVMDCSLQLDKSDKNKSSMDEPIFFRTRMLEGSEITESNTQTDAKPTFVSENRVPETPAERERMGIATVIAGEGMNKIQLEGSSALDCSLQVVDMASMYEFTCLKINTAEGSEVIELDTETDANLALVSENGVPEKLTAVEQMENADLDISKTQLEGPSAIHTEDVMDCSVQLDESDKDESSMDGPHCLKTSIVEEAEVIESDTETDGSLTLVSENRVSEKFTEVERIEIASVAVEEGMNNIHLEGPSAIHTEDVMECSVQLDESDKDESSMDEPNCFKTSIVEESEVIESDIETDRSVTLVSENRVSEKLTEVERIEIAVFAAEEGMNKIHFEGPSAIHTEDVMDCSVQLDESDKEESSMDEPNCFKTSIVEESEVIESDIETDRSVTLVSENRVSEKLTEVERIEIAVFAAEEGMNKIHFEGPSAIHTEDVMDCSLQVVESDKEESSMDEYNCLKITSADGSDATKSDTETDAIILVSENGVPEKLIEVEQMLNAEQDIRKTHWEEPSVIDTEGVTEGSSRVEKSDKDKSSMDEHNYLRTSIVKVSELTQLGSEADASLTPVSENVDPETLTDMEGSETVALVAEADMNTIHLVEPCAMDAEHVKDCSLQVMESDKDKSFMYESSCLKIRIVGELDDTEMDSEIDANGMPVTLTGLEWIKNAEQDINTHFERSSVMESVSPVCTLKVDTNSTSEETLKLLRALQGEEGKHAVEAETSPENVLYMDTSIAEIPMEESMRQFDFTLLSLRSLREMCRSYRQPTRKSSASASAKQSNTNTQVSTRDLSAENAIQIKDFPSSSKRPALRALSTNIPQNNVVGKQGPTLKSTMPPECKRTESNHNCLI